MAISSIGSVSTLVPDAPPRPAPEQPADQTAANQSTQADNPRQAVTPPSTDTRIEREPPRDRQVDVLV